MLLRRVIEHVRSQNWTAVLIDFVIVVIGVFVGIQVSNWNEERRDAIRAHEYLERIRDDLVRDIATFDSRIDFWESVITAGNSALAFARGEAPKDRTSWSELLMFYHASQWLPLTSVSTTFQEMKSSGEMALIADTELRDEVSRYYFSVEWREPLYRVDPAYRKTVRGLTPVPVQNYLWEECYEEGVTGTVLSGDCDAPIPETETRQVLEQYLTSPDVVSDLRFWVINLDVAVGAAVQDRDRAKQLVTQIEEQLQ